MIHLLSFILASLLSLPASAGKNLDDVLERNERPTIKDILPAIREISSSHAMPVPVNGHYANFEFFFNALMKDGPRFVASIEGAFPNAHWVFLGRDSMVLADLTEAFYLSIGQHNRVIRIGVSKPSFLTENGNSVSDARLVEMLESYGISLEGVNKGKKFIFIDTVSTGGGRQGKDLLSALYRTHLENGGKIEKLVHRLNMIGVIVSTFSGQENPIDHAEEFLRQTSDQFERGKLEVLHFRDSGGLFGEAGYEHFTEAWTDSYGHLRKNGKILRATLGRRKGKNIRLSIVMFQKMIVKGVLDGDFLERANNEAKKRNFAFKKAPRGNLTAARCLR